MDAQFEDRVYNNYRAAMRRYRSRSYAHTPALRQRARAATATRYNVSYADVKRIVARFDEARGVAY